MTTPKKPTTLSQLCDSYISALPEMGKSASTAKSYAGDLALAKKHLGEDTELAKITPKDIGIFFASDAVNLTRKGAPKNRITTDKIKRVLRLAFAWAEEEGFIEKSPVAAKSPKTDAKAAPKTAKPPVLKKPAKKTKTTQEEN